MDLKLFRVRLKLAKIQSWMARCWKYNTFLLDRFLGSANTYKEGLMRAMVGTRLWRA